MSDLVFLFLIVVTLECFEVQMCVLYTVKIYVELVRVCSIYILYTVSFAYRSNPLPQS